MSDQITLKALKWVQNGYTLCRNDSGETGFLHGALPGETVRAEISKSTSSHFFARTLEVLEVSPSRIPSDCASFPRCGGCSFRHMSYEDELKVKIDLIRELHPLDECLEKVRARGGEHFTVHSSTPNGYRNHAQLQCEKQKKGFFSPHSNDIVDLPPEGCRQLSDNLNEAAGKFSPHGKLKARFRETYEGIFGPEELKKLRVIREKITVNDSEFIWEMPSGGFFQNNRFLLGEWLAVLENSVPTGKPATIELFCGSGVIGGHLREKIGAYSGYELDRESLKCAKINFHAFGIQGKFFHSDLYKNPPELKTDLIICNPPRAGLKNALLGGFQKTKARSVLYSSCSTHTLSRDLAFILKAGFEPVRAAIFDFFPRTPHLEVVIRLDRS